MRTPINTEKKRKYTYVQPKNKEVQQKIILSIIKKYRRSRNKIQIYYDKYINH